MKGILLAGGEGTRLYPTTKAISKQLIPIYDKPAIYYPLSILMLGDIREILIISTPRDLPMIQSLLGDGSHLGVSLQYAVQKKPRGIAEAFIIGEDFVRKDNVTLILGDNFLYGNNLPGLIRKSAQMGSRATVFVYQVQNPSAFGVIEFDDEKRPIGLEEKPAHPRSNWAVTGLYCYDCGVTEIAKSLKPSLRGELEISDINRCYLERKELDAVRLGRGISWLDMGTPDSLLSCAQFVEIVEKRQGLRYLVWKKLPTEGALLGRIRSKHRRRKWAIPTMEITLGRSSVVHSIFRCLSILADRHL